MIEETEPNAVATVESAPMESSAREWQARIRKAEKKQKEYHPWWDAAMDLYAPKVTETPSKYGLAVRTNRAFSVVERKISDLFYQRPDMSVASSPLLDAIPEGAVISAAMADILNEKLGTDGVRARAVMRKAIFDLELCGCGWVAVGYKAFTQDVPQTVPVMDAMGQPAVDEFTGAPITTIEVVPVTVKSECYFKHFSPRQALIPHDFKSTDYDEAPWLGRKFDDMPLSEARRMFGDKIPDDFEAGDQDNEARFTTDGEAPDRDKTLVSGVAISYRTSVFKPEIIHPDHLSELVFINGIVEPVLDRPSPHQTFDDQGRLTPDSLVGHPFEAIVTRSMTDSAYVMSDVAVIMPQVNELDKYRQQLVQQRDLNLLKWLCSDAVPKEALEKISVSQAGGIITIPADVLAMFDQHFRQFQHGSYPPENWNAASLLDNDISRTIAIDANAMGVVNQGGQTATESNLVQANRNVAIGAEQNAVAECYIKAVTKFATIVTRYLSVEDAAAIIGMEKAQLWDTWRKALPVRLSFTMQPDSQLRNDTPLERKQLQDLYTYLANEPRVRREPLLTELLQKWHLDPSKMVVPDAEMQKPGPQPPSTSLGFKGDDFNPLNPQAAIMVDLWQKITGVQVDPDAVKNAMMAGMLAQKIQAEQAAVDAAQKGDPPHGGKLAPRESIDKHQVDKTGGQEGTGAMMPGLGGNAGGII